MLRVEKDTKAAWAASAFAMALFLAPQITRGQSAKANSAAGVTGTSESKTSPKTAPADAQNAEILQELEQMRARITVLEAQLRAAGHNGAETSSKDAPTQDLPTRAGLRPAPPDQSAPTTRGLVDGAQGMTSAGVAEAGEPVDASVGSASGGSTSGQAASVVGAGSTGNQTASNSTENTLEGLLRGTTVNFLFDGYYAYNFNAPIGQANLLRAYDVSSNSFSINQADLVLENAPDPEHGKRYGGRIDFQYGQATQTLQGNPANEARPDIYRALFQAYGTYIAPVGSGLRVDFGKWASALGIENNYTKDQNDYSRSFWFDFLPFYHMGVRTSYQVNHWLTANYWLVNGTQQTEDFNGFKDELFGVVLQPKPSVSWTVNYYFGQEHPSFMYVPGGTGLPVVQGEPLEPIADAPTGKLHIFDSYVSWSAAPKLSLALEGDYVIERLYTTSAPAHTGGGAAYARYQLTPKFAIASRGEYMSDHGGLFSGTTQALKEVTLTGQYQFYPGFMMFEEWRRDFSNQPYFLTDTPGLLRNEQTTATAGLVWWFGPKTGSW